MEDKLKSTASKLLEKAEERAKEQERLQEDLKELKNEFNAVFSTKAGIKVARMMMKLSGIYNVNKTATDPVIMGEHRGMAKMYLVMIKGMLKADLIAEIERPNVKGEN